MVPQNLTVAGVWPIVSGHYGVEKFPLRSVIPIERPSGLDCALRSPSARAGTRLTHNLVYTFADYSCFVGRRLTGGGNWAARVVNPGPLIVGNPRTGARPHHSIEGVSVPGRYARIDVFGPRLNVYRDLCR